MKYAALLFILLVNCGLFLVALMLNVPGNGDDSSWSLVLYFGSGWVVLAHLISLALLKRGRGEIAFAIAVLTLPAGAAFVYASTSAFEMYSSFKLDSPEFQLACQSTALKYLHKPNSPVRSVAYDWAPNQYPPQYSYFKMDERRNISAESRGYSSLHPQIDFLEGRCCRNEGPPGNGVGPFVRHPRKGAYYGVSELSADALVTFSQVKSLNVDSKAEVFTWQVSVQDRRNGQILAEMRYSVDWRNRRACGETSPGLMDERAFVLRAINVQ
jgi:hypothetical protein